MYEGAQPNSTPCTACSGPNDIYYYRLNVHEPVITLLRPERVQARSPFLDKAFTRSHLGPHQKLTPNKQTGGDPWRVDIILSTLTTL